MTQKYLQNIDRKTKILIVFEDMIADTTTTNKTFQAIIKELFIRCRKLNISPVFIEYISHNLTFLFQEKLD